MFYIFCVDTMGKINLDSLNKLMAEKATRLKKPSIESSLVAGAVDLEIVSIVEALSL